VAKRVTDPTPAAAPQQTSPPVTLEKIWEAIQSLQKQGEITVVSLDALTAAVQALTNQVAEAVTEIQNLEQEVATGQTDQTTIDQLTADIDAQSTALYNALHPTPGSGPAPTPGSGPAPTPAAPQTSRPTSPAPAPPARPTSPPAAPGQRRIGGT
jgi:hypothetical protein